MTCCACRDRRGRSDGGTVHFGVLWSIGIHWSIIVIDQCSARPSPRRWSRPPVSSTQARESSLLPRSTGRRVRRQRAAAVGRFRGPAREKTNGCVQWQCFCGTDGPAPTCLSLACGCYGCPWIGRAEWGVAPACDHDPSGEQRCARVEEGNISFVDLVEILVTTAVDK